MESIRLSVIIPAYNEEQRLPKTLESVREYLSKQSYASEVLVVSDGSKDRTCDLVREYMPSFPGLRVIEEAGNRGKGYAVKRGMEEAKGAFRLFMDADNATTVDQVEKMWPKVEEGFEVVIGSRDIKGADIAVAQSWWRRRLGDIFNLLVQTMSGLWGLWDTQCGFKGFTAKAAGDIFPHLTIERWAFDVEVLVIAKKKGYRIAEVPVRWVNDPHSKVKLKGMIRMLKEIGTIRMNMTMKRYG